MNTFNNFRQIILWMNSKGIIMDESLRKKLKKATSKDFALTGSTPKEKVEEIIMNHQSGWRGFKYGSITSPKKTGGLRNLFLVKAKPIVQLDEQGNVIAEYPSVRQCSKQLNISRFYLVQHLHGRLKDVDVKIFKYKENEK
jgi:hypothetical protein